MWTLVRMGSSVKNNLRPLKISQYFIMLGLIALISVGATVLVVQSKFSNMLSMPPFQAVGYWAGSLLSELPLISNLRIPFEALGLFIFILTGLLMTLCSVAVRRLLKSRGSPDYRYIDGPKLLEGAVAIKDANHKLRKEPSKLSLNIHPKIKITEQLEAGSILIQGQAGAGKSTIVKPLVRQIYALPMRSFTYDEKGEYQSTFNTKSSICLQLTNQAEWFWDIGKDITNTNEAALVAQAMIELENENQRFFTDAARQIFKYVIISLVVSKETWSWRDLSKSLFCSEHELRSLLTDVSAAAATLIEPGTKTTQSIRSVLSTQLFWLDDMAKMQESAQNTWCISDLITGETDKTHIFFRPQYTSPDLSKAVCNSLITLIIERWLSRDDSSSDCFWLLLDELGNLPKNPSLVRWLTLSRAKGGRTLATTQDVSQLYEAYGENTTDTILSLFRTVIVMRLGASGPAAQKASDLLGQQRVITVNENLSEDEKLSFSTQYHDRPVASREEIINLPSADQTGVVGLMFIGGLENIYKLKWPYLKSKTERVTNQRGVKNKKSLMVDKKKPVLKPVNRLNKRQVKLDAYKGRESSC